MAHAAHCPASTPAAPPRLRPLAWLRPWTPRTRLLDPETLPDSLRRDLGLADGRGAPPRDLMRD